MLPYRDEEIPLTLRLIDLRMRGKSAGLGIRVNTPGVE